MLALETATSACSVALSHGAKVYFRYSEETRSHSQLAMRMIDAVLTEAGSDIGHVDSLGVTVGPGSFTGLRIGFAIVQGLAFAMDLPVAAVSTLEALVTTYRRGHAESGESLYVAVLDARMEQFAVGVYRWNGKKLIVDKDDCLMSADAVHQLIDELRPTAVIGETEKLLSLRLGKIELRSIEMLDVYPHALDVHELARARHQSGLSVSIDDIELRYLRGSEAWTKRTKRIGIAKHG